MVIAPLTEAERYTALHPLFSRAFEFLRSPGSVALPDGRHEIDGARLYAVVTRAQGRSPNEVVLEAHRQYIDIHYVLSGVDSIGWRPVEDCTESRRPYDSTEDVELFPDTPVSWPMVHPGSFAILFPEDAHAPLISPDMLHKIVLKVSVAG